MALAIVNGDIYTGVDDGRIIKNGYIGINNQNIELVTEDSVEINNFIEKYKGSLETIDASGKIILPGLVNAHTHSAMTILRNYGSDRVLHDWLFNKIIPKEQLLTEDDVYWGTMAAQLEMVKSGTTAFADMYFNMDAVAKAIVDGGLRANIAAPPLSNDWSTGSRKTKSNISYAENFINKWNGACDDRITTYVELHSVYLYDTSMLNINVQIAKDKGVGIHIHLHETAKEVEDCITENGIRPIELLLQKGVFDVPVLAAHCVVMTDGDIQILKDKNVNVAHNPTSNLKLASGIAPVFKMLNNQINVALGTDGCASNNNLNLFEEMHLTALLHKGIEKDPTILNARQVIKMATQNGAKAIGFGETVGTIKAGMAADIIIVNCSEIHMTPVNDIEAAIVYSMQASDVETTIVNGKILMKNRIATILDEEMIKYKINSIANRLGLNKS